MCLTILHSSTKLWAFGKLFIRSSWHSYESYCFVLGDRDWNFSKSKKKQK